MMNVRNLILAVLLAAPLTSVATAQVNFNKAKDLARQAAGQANEDSAQTAKQEPAGAEEPSDKLSTEQIVDKTNYVSYYQGKDGRAQVRMTIVNERGQKRNREFRMLRWDAQPGTAKDLKGDAEFTGEQKFYVYFTAPADIDKTVFLVHKHLDKDDDRWLYVPGLDLVKRISSADKRTSFVGSHFFYEDVSGRNVNADKHELLNDESNATYYVLKNTPKDPDTVKFDHYKMWIHRDSFVVVQISYYDEQGREYRRYNALKVDKDPKYGYPVVTKSRMTDLRTQGYTELVYPRVEFNVGLPESLFTERYLRKPPHQYLK